MSLKKYLTVTRPLNGLISMIGVFTGYSIAQKAFSFSPELGFGMIAAFLINGGGNAINDYYDIKIDKKLGKKSEFNQKILFAYSLLLFMLGIIFAGFINNDTIIIAATVSILLIIYSGLMQQMKYIGNWVVALGTALTLVFGAAIIGNYEVIFLLAATAMFANAAREIIKDAEDLKGDAGNKKTLPMMLGFEKIKKIVLITYAIAIGIAVIAWLLRLITGPYYILFLIGAGALFFNSWELLRAQKFKAAQQYSKYGMVVALLAFLGAVI